MICDPQNARNYRSGPTSVQTSWGLFERLKMLTSVNRRPKINTRQAFLRSNPSGSSYHNPRGTRVHPRPVNEPYLDGGKNKCVRSVRFFFSRWIFDAHSREISSAFERSSTTRSSGTISEWGGELTKTENGFSPNARRQGICIPYNLPKRI